MEYPEDPKPHGSRHHESGEADESRRNDEGTTTRRSERRREREARPKPREPREPGESPRGVLRKVTHGAVGGWSLKGFFSKGLPQKGGFFRKSKIQGWVNGMNGMNGKLTRMYQIL